MATERRDFDAATNDPDRNPDPITGAPGAHPIGTGVGAAGGGAAGAAIGAAVSGPAFPVGAAIGAVVGAIAGGLAGKGAAEAVNPTAEDEYWRDNYRTRPYYEPSFSYEEDYRPAYEYGWMAGSKMSGQRFDDVEPEMGKHWGTTKSTSKLGWDKAKHAARDAWDRVSQRDRMAHSSGQSRDNLSGMVGQPQAYPGHASPSNLSEDDSESLSFAQNCRTRYAGRNFDDIENDLRRDWDTSHRGSSRTWENVKDSVRRAWHKVERAIPGDADRDGR